MVTVGTKVTMKNKETMATMANYDIRKPRQRDSAFRFWIVLFSDSEIPP